MKQTSIKTLYRLFAYLSDRTNGFKPFVKYKLVLGALLVGLTANACKGKPTPTVPVANPNEWDDVMCYEPAAPSDEDTVAGEDIMIPPITEPIITEHDEIVLEEPMCYMIDIVEPMVTCYDPVYIPDTTTVPVDTNKVYHHVEIMPSFPEGAIALLEYITTNYHYPKVASDIITGRIFVRFIVRSTGKIDSVTVLRGLCPRLDKEAVRVVESMPCWIPGRQNGEAVDVYYTIPIRINFY